MKRLTLNELLEVVCAPVIIDAPEESDYVASDDNAEENYVKDLIVKK